MDAFKARLQQIAERIDALSVRERGLVFIVVLGVLYTIAWGVVFGPLRAETAKLDRELKTKYQEIRSVDEQISVLFNSNQQGQSQGQARVAELTQKLADLDSQMDRMTAGVVTPKEMAKLVEQMLLRNKNLELIKLEALPSMPVDSEEKSDTTTVAAAQTPAVPGSVVYRHGMRIEFKGRYFDIVEYLKTLEKLQWKVFWGEVKLETDKYPYSRVSLVIYTLSRYPAWIGV